LNLSVIVPIYNEFETIPELQGRLNSACENITNSYEIIFINDGSKDNSLNRLKQYCKENEHLKYVNFSRNFGHQIAVTAGLDFAKGEHIVIIDGDLQDPPEVIPKLYNKLKEGFDVVYAKRSKRAGESYFKKLTAKIFYRILKSITNIEIPVDTGDFRIINKRVLNELKKMPEKNKFIRGQISWIGFRQTSVEYQRDERKYGETGYPFSKMLKFAIDGITAFSDVPLRFVRNLGLLVALFAFLVILYAIFSHFILKQTITGWSSLIISSMFIGGIQLFSVGIIGEYISRINTNILNRPLYIVEDTNCEDDLTVS